MMSRTQARTHVQLALACEQSLIHAQRRLRHTMQHVYGHSGNLGNKFADHTAALDTFGLISNHNVATRWIHHNFDTSVRFRGCNNISQVLTSRPQDGSYGCFFFKKKKHGSTVFLCISRGVWSFVSFALNLSLLGSCFLNHVMDSLSSSASTVPSIDDYFGCWNCFSSSRLVVFSLPISWKSTWPRSHFLVSLLLIYFVTRRRCLLLHDDTLGTTAHGVPYVVRGTIAIFAWSCLARR